MIKETQSAGAATVAQWTLALQAGQPSGRHRDSSYGEASRLTERAHRQIRSFLADENWRDRRAEGA
jgi:hypothetical protein